MKPLLESFDVDAIEAGWFGKNTGIAGIAAHDTGQHAVATGFLVHHAFDDQIAFESNPGGLQGLNHQQIADNATFHIRRTPTYTLPSTNSPL